MKLVPHVCPLPGGAAFLLGASLHQAIWIAFEGEGFCIRS